MRLLTNKKREGKKNMITKKEFINAVKTNIRLISKKKVEMNMFSKTFNNDKEVEMFSVEYSRNTEATGNIGVAADMDGCYESFCQNGQDISLIDQCAVEILEMLDENVKRAAQFENTARLIADYGSAKPMLRFKLVNGKLNQKNLHDLPHVPYLDLEVVFYLETNTHGYTHENLMVNNQIFEGWGVSLEKMYEDTLGNMQMVYKPFVISMDATIMTIVSSDPMLANLPNAPFHEAALYALTNEQQLYGAVTMLYPGILEKCAEIIGGDFCIFPSSVHEVLFCLIKGDEDAEELKEMVQDVNLTSVSPNAVLSDHPYFYSTKTKKVTMDLNDLK